MPGWFPLRERFDVPCTIEIENTFESLHAYVSLEGDIPIHPGDEVLVLGDPVRVPFGEKRTLQRQATVTRANAIERWWTKLTGRLEMGELCEFSFSSGSKL